MVFPLSLWEKHPAFVNVPAKQARRKTSWNTTEGIQEAVAFNFTFPLKHVIFPRQNCQIFKIGEIGTEVKITGVAPKSVEVKMGQQVAEICKSNE